MEEKETIYVIGHKNPDTDSVCSAICYARLKEKIRQVFASFSFQLFIFVLLLLLFEFVDFNSQCFISF